MTGRCLKLGLPEVAAIIGELHRKERVGWRKNRLLAVKLAAQGNMTSAEVAEVCGISRGHLFEWLKAVRTGGIEMLLSMGTRGRPKGWRKGVSTAVMEAFEAKLKAGEFVTMEQARQWLAEEHGIKTDYQRVWYWAKKLNGVLKVPRPSHSKKDPLAAEQFRQDLGAKFEQLGLAQGTRAKVWVMDEARFGLHAMLRKLWSVRGAPRPVVSSQIRYEWDYLHGALEVTGGEAHFCHVPQVNLESDALYLADLANTDPGTVHVVIRDQAGFHLRDGDARLPSNIRIIDLPPYSPELNPCEQLWDLIKDALGNRVFASVEDLRRAMLPVLESWWTLPERVLSLIGRPWLQAQANTLYKSF
jgi:transposase